MDGVAGYTLEVLIGSEAKERVGTTTPVAVAWSGGEAKSDDAMRMPTLPNEMVAGSLAGRRHAGWAAPERGVTMPHRVRARHCGDEAVSADRRGGWANHPGDEAWPRAYVMS